MYPARYVNLEAARRAFGERVDRLAQFFDKVDVVADAAVEAVSNTKGGWGMFTRALDRGIETVSDAPEDLRALFASVDRVPAWVDFGVIERGGEVLRRAGPLGGIVLGAKSLVHGYASPAGNKPLIFSGRLREQAGRRLNETAKFVEAVCGSSGLRRFSEGFKISVKVRLMHAQVRKMILASGRWRADLWGAPLNQHDLSATSLLFSQAVIVGLRTLGVHITSEEADSYIHLWRYASSLLGGELELLPASEVEALRLAELIGMTMGEPDDDSRKLVEALMEAELSELDRTDLGRRWAQHRSQFGYAMARELVGEDLAEKLGMPLTPWRFVIPPMRAFVGAMEIVRARSEIAHRTAIDVGTRYWRRVIDVGLGGATAEFGLPQVLSVAMAR